MVDVVKPPKVVLPHAAECVRVYPDTGKTADIPAENGAAQQQGEFLRVTTSSDGGMAIPLSGGEIAGFAASPRGAARMLNDRKPLLLIDRLFPNAGCTHKIVWVSGTELWGYGADFSLRKSIDGGASWGKALSSSAPSSARWAVDGFFLKTSAGSLLTTSHPNNLSEPKIIRSADGGVTWTDVVAAQPNIQYLGPTSICQDPITGYIYLTEYVTVSAATQATWKISRSTDDGATWSVFKTFQRDAVAYPTAAVRHGHSIQWDPVGLRIWFLCGDAEKAAGLYRVTADGTDVEPVITNAQLDNSAGQYAGAVGVMFFPNYVVWGVDQTTDSRLLRMHRSQIGAASPEVEMLQRLQSTAWYTCRLASSNTEWLMGVSNETGVGRVDPAIHIYRVANDGATCDEVMSIPTKNDTTFARAYAVGTPLQATTAEGLVWIGTNITMPLTANGTLERGQQFAAILGWGVSAFQQQNNDRLPYYTISTQSSGYVSLSASEKKFFGVTEAPIGATRLYILDAGREQFAGAGLFYVEVYNQTTGAVLKLEDNTTLMQWQNRSMRSAKNEGSAPYVFRSVPVSPGTQIRFRLNEVLAAAAEGTGYITYAWGI